MKLSDLNPSEYNPRKISDEQLQRLKKSLAEFGDLSGIVFNRQTGNVIGGHQRLKCLPPDAKIEKTKLKKPSPTGTIATGIITIDGEQFTYREVDWPLEKEKQANIAANKHGGEWDDEALAALLNELKDLPDFDPDLIGFETKEMDELISRITGEGLIDDDEAPEINTPEPITKIGDIYILGGRHRVMCGDSTKIEDVGRLMDGKKADMVFTDPPYGIGKNIKNDNLSEAELREFNFMWLKTTTGITKEDAHFVCFHSPRLFLTVVDYLSKCGWNFERYMNLYKPNDCTFPWQGWILKSESILLARKGNAKYNKIEPYLHDTMQHLHGAEQKEDRGGHPACKPTSFVTNFIKRFDSLKILDLFLGSGSTLIACEKTNRICYGMELDPHYCDVIVTRYCKYTGSNKIIKNGEEVDWPL